MRLRNCVILCSLLTVFISMGSGFAADFSFRAPKGECVFTFSPRAEKSLAVAALSRLNVRLSNICTSLPEQMDDPFSRSSLEIWRTAAATAQMGFWMDVSSDGTEMTVRGIDLVSLLSFGQASATSVNLTETSKVNLVKSLVDRVVEEYPYVGFIEGKNFFAWTKAGTAKVLAVKRAGFERHPFLPFLLKSDFESFPGSGGMLVRREDDRTWKLNFQKEFTGSNERLWLKLVSSEAQ